MKLMPDDLNPMSEQSIKPKISVIICTHNPREEYLQRTLEALEKQSLPKDQWELLLIDNASKQPLVAGGEKKRPELRDQRSDDRDRRTEVGDRRSDDGDRREVGEVYLSWHPNARIVREESLGLTVARLRGIAECRADLLVFVDDDNVLFSDYLEQCLKISDEWPMLGAWGGQQFPEFEGGAPAEQWKVGFYTGTIDKNVWSNNYDPAAVPIGAGMCIRKTVAEEYGRKAATDDLRRQLGRAGAVLNSGEDFDLAFTACDQGLGAGRFRNLKLQHLIPQSRLRDEYIENLCEGFGYSDAILKALRGEVPSLRGRVDRLVDAYKTMRLPQHVRIRMSARKRGYARAVAHLQSIK